jgi:hypothetical protein
MLKNILRIFHGYFHKLVIFNTKFITEIQFCMKNIHEKIIMYFSSIGHHIISYIAKFEVKIPLVRGEIKK